MNNPVTGEGDRALIPDTSGVMLKWPLLQKKKNIFLAFGQQGAKRIVLKRSKATDFKYHFDHSATKIYK